MPQGEITMIAVHLAFSAAVFAFAGYVVWSYVTRGRLPGMPEPTICNECGARMTGSWDHCLECYSGDVVGPDGEPKPFRTTRYEILRGSEV